MTMEDWESFWDDVGKPISIMVGIAIAFFAVLIGISMSSQYLWDKNVECPAYGDQLDRPTKYDWAAGGCFIQTKGGDWVPARKYWLPIQP